MDNKENRLQYDIHASSILRGIKLCIQNSNRHKQEAKILFENDCYQSSIVSLLIAIEEFAKGAWLYSVILLQTKNESAIKDISDKNARPYFKLHRTKIRYFFNFVKRIPNYKVKSGVNKFIGMNEDIDNEQDYKLRMIYVDYVNRSTKRKRYGEIDGWLDPQYIPMIAFAEEEKQMAGLSTKYNELFEDLETAWEYFHKNMGYGEIKSHILEIPDNGKIIIFVKKQLNNQLMQIESETKGYAVKVTLCPQKNQKWVTKELCHKIENAIKKSFQVTNVTCKIYQK